MNTNTLPTEEKKFLQTNRTDTYPLANLWESSSLDLQSNVGTLRVSPRLRMLSSSSDDGDLGLPVGFRQKFNKVWAICGNRVFTNSGETDDPFAEDATTGFQTDYNPDESDIEIFNDVVVTSTTDALMSCDNTAWTSRDVLSVGSPHVMTYFRKYDRLYYSDLSSRIISINTSWVTADPGSPYAILINAVSDSRFITCLESTSQSIWAGTIDTSRRGALGYVCQWDGLSAQLTNEFPLGNSIGCMALTVDPVTDSPIAMGADGILYGWNGGGFSEMGRLPFADKLPYNVADPDSERFIHPNGMYVTKNGNVRCHINNRADVTGAQVAENMPSGIWEWSKENGFIHIMPPTYTPVSASTITDFGQNRVARVGALFPLQQASTTLINGTLLAGCELYLDENSSTKTAIFINDTNDGVRKAGRFTTAWMESKEVEDNWQRLWVIYRRLLSDTSKIVFKYRLEEEDPIVASITWVSTTSFTTTTDITAYGPTATGFDGTYGGEVDVVRGTGGSQLRHITSIVNNAGTYTVTLDGAVTGVTTLTANARFQKWIKLLPEITGQVNSYAGLPIIKNSPRIQLRGYFEFLGKEEFKKYMLYSTDFLDIQA